MEIAQSPRILKMAKVTNWDEYSKKKQKTKKSINKKKKEKKKKKSAGIASSLIKKWHEMNKKRIRESKCSFLVAKIPERTVKES